MLAVVREGTHIVPLSTGMIPVGDHRHSCIPIRVHCICDEDRRTLVDALIRTPSHQHRWQSNTVLVGRCGRTFYPRAPCPLLLRCCHAVFIDAHAKEGRCAGLRPKGSAMIE